MSSDLVIEGINISSLLITKWKELIDFVIKSGYCAFIVGNVW